MKKLLLVSVTEDHIKKGRKHEAYSCPVALALKDATQDKYATVGRDCFFSDGDSGRLSPEAREYVLSFDSGYKIKPRLFVFEIGGGGSPMTRALDKQAQAVIREYREALQDHNVDLALRIYNANLDMWKALAQTEDEMLEEVGCSADDLPDVIADYLAARVYEREGYGEEY